VPLLYLSLSILYTWNIFSLISSYSLIRDFIFHHGKQEVFVIEYFLPNIMMAIHRYRIGQRVDLLNNEQTVNALQFLTIWYIFFFKYYYVCWILEFYFALNVEVFWVNWQIPTPQIWNNMLNSTLFIIVFNYKYNQKLAFHRKKLLIL